MTAVTTTIINEGKKEILGEYQVIGVAITREINRIPQAKIKILDKGKAGLEFRLDAGGEIAYGKQLTITIKYVQDDQSKVVKFVGIVTKKDIQASVQGATYTVTLKDRVSILEYRHLPPEFGRLTDDTAIEKVLKAAQGDKVEVGDIELFDSGDKPNEEKQNNQVLPDNTKAWDFLVTRAEAHGSAVVVINGKVSIAKLPDVNKPGSDVVEIKELLKRENVQGFTLKSEPRNKPNKVVAWAWDPDKGELLEQEEASDLPNEQKSGLGETEANYGAIAGEDPQKAKKKIDAKIRYLGLSIDQGSLNLAGDATFSLLNVLELSELTNTVSIKHLLTGIVHNVTPSGWKTTLKIGRGRESHAERFAISTQKIEGIYLGKVSEIEEDPESELRIGVKVPGLNSNSMFWARLASIDAGKERGVWFRPEPDDEVVVGFVQGEGNNAVVLGSLYSSARKPYKDWQAFDDANSRKGIATKSGALIEFVDSGEKNKSNKSIIRIQTATKSSITLDDDKEVIELKDSHGNMLTMSSEGISLKSAKDLKLAADVNVVITGSAVDIE